MRPIVVAYNGTPEADDGLALGRLLAGLHGARLVVACVLPDVHSDETTDRGTQLAIRRRRAKLRAGAEWALPVGTRFELWPLFGVPVAEGLSALAADSQASMIVLGSTHRGPLGRVVLGSSAASTTGRSPVPVAVAPRGFRDHARLDPPAIGAAFDGSPEAAEALRHADALAQAAGAALRVLAVDPDPQAREELVRRCTELGAEPVIVHGDAAARLAAESQRLELLVCGSRGRGPLGRLVSGSVSTALMSGARCPLVVVPSRVAAASASTAPALVTHA